MNLNADLRLYTVYRITDSELPMPDRNERARRKELLHSLQDQQRQKTREDFPAPILALKRLFDFLDLRLSKNVCDDTLRFTHEYVRHNDMDERRLAEWLEQHGGFCDCEVLNNVEPAVEEAVPGYDRIGNETGSVN